MHVHLYVVSFNLLEQFARLEIMTGTSNSAFDSSVSPLEFFTALPLAHTVHSPSSGTPCTNFRYVAQLR